MQLHKALLPLFAVGLASCGSMGSNLEPSPTSPNSYISGSDYRVAIGGYDVVAYWTEGQATEGSSEWTVEWAGTTWQFASEKNRNMFREEPARYAPEYGGHCAYGVAFDETPRGDPDAWKIMDGNLYLFGNEDARKKWLDGDTEKLILRADANWPQLKNKVVAQ